MFRSWFLGTSENTFHSKLFKCGIEKERLLISATCVNLELKRKMLGPSLSSYFPEAVKPFLKLNFMTEKEKKVNK